MEEKDIFRYRKAMISKNGIIILLPTSWNKEQFIEVALEAPGDGTLIIKPFKFQKKEKEE